MHHFRLAPHSLAFLAIVLGGCGDDSVGTVGDPTGAQSSSTGTTAEPGTGTEPTSTSTTSGETTSGATEAMTSSTGTTQPVDPTTGSTGDTSTGDTSTGDTSSTGDSSSTGDTSTGEDCPEDGVFCEGDVAITCAGRIKTEEQCELCLEGVGCVECQLAAPEVCDGLDNDCDGVADNGEVCGAGSCSGSSGQCDELPIPTEQPLVSGCRQQFPPTAGLPCPIAEPGEQFHVSAATGDDANDGKTPETAWATLCHAVATAPSGSTLRVAEGQYASSEVYIGKALTVKGGFDASFAAWDPDAHPTTFYGRLNLDHNAAVFGGFRIIANPLVADAWSYAHHFVGAGTLVRNYIEIVATAGADDNVLNLYGIVASACANGVSVLRCNDIYVRSSAPQAFVVSAVEYGNHALHAGQGVLDSNRICQDGGSFAAGAIGGYGSCFPQSVSLLLRNNVIEKAGFGGDALSFYSCGEGDMSLTLTNNTIFSDGNGISASGDPLVMMLWKLTNNIVFSFGGGSTAIDVGQAGVQISTSEGNLVFGYQNNAISPAPLMTAGDDVSGMATPATVFVDAPGGDLHLNPGGPGVDTGINVYGLPEYGVVKSDIVQLPRFPDGPWDRGAFAAP